MINLETKEQALTAALYLAITAPNDDLMRECIDHAETIANSGMTIEQVTQCKLEAQELAHPKHMEAQ